MTSTDLTPESPLSDLLAAYRRDHTLQTDSYAQLRVAAGNFGRWHLAAHGAAPPVAALSRTNLHDWLDWTVGPPTRWSPATANSKRTALVSLANFAAESKPPLITPVGRVKRLTEGADPPEGWQLDEFDRLLWSASLESRAWLPGLDAGRCWDFGLRMIWDSGARFSELWLAEVDHVKLSEKTWLVPARNRKGKRQGRLYTLSEETCRRIAATLAESPRARLWPFPFNKRQVWYHFERILIRAGLPANRRSKWHCVRRTAESHAAARRGKEWAAEAVGHTLAVAQRHYFAPAIVRTPSLSEALPVPNPRPVFGVVG